MGNIREKVSSIKENYDKKFNELLTQFKEVETLFLNGYFEQQTLGDLKNSKQKQKDIIMKITGILDNLDKLNRDVRVLKSNSSEFEFFTFESIRN